MSISFTQSFPPPPIIGRFSVRAESIFSMMAVVNVMVWSFTEFTKHFYLVRCSNFALARRINSFSKLSFKVLGILHRGDLYMVYCQPPSPRLVFAGLRFGFAARRSYLHVLDSSWNINFNYFYPLFPGRCTKFCYLQ